MGRGGGGRVLEKLLCAGSKSFEMVQSSNLSIEWCTDSSVCLMQSSFRMDYRT